MKFLQIFNSMNPFHKPSAEAVARQHLEDSERELLVHAAEASYHARMVDYYTDNVARLKDHPAKKVQAKSSVAALPTSQSKLRPTAA